MIDCEWVGNSIVLTLFSVQNSLFSLKTEYTFMNRYLLPASLFWLLTVCASIGLAQDRLPDRRAAIFSEVNSLSRLEPEDWVRTYHLALLAESQARAGLTKEAIETFDSFSASLRSKSYPVVSQIGLLVKMALAAHKTGHHALGLQFLRKASDLAKAHTLQEKPMATYADVMELAHQVQLVIETALRMGEESIADDVLARATQTIIAWPDAVTIKLNARISMLMGRSRTELSLGKKQAADHSLSSALQLIIQLPQLGPCNFLPEVAEIQAELGQLTDAIETVNQCVVARQNVFEDVYRRDVDEARDLANVARAAWKAGDRTEAPAMLERAVTLGRTTPYDDGAFYWRQLVRAAAEMRRGDILEEGIAGVHENRDNMDWYSDIFTILLSVDRHDLIERVIDPDGGGQDLVQALIERGDHLRALKAGEQLGFGKNIRGDVVRDLARVQAEMNAVDTALGWARAWEDSTNRIACLVGVADYLSNRPFMATSQ